MTKYEATARKIIQAEYERNPERSLLALGKRRQDMPCIGAWDKNQSRFVVVAGCDEANDWFSMSYELLIDGKPIEIDWTPLPASLFPSAVIAY